MDKFLPSDRVQNGSLQPVRPSWAFDPPPATQPALPPIRSAHFAKSQQPGDLTPSVVPNTPRKVAPLGENGPGKRDIATPDQDTALAPTKSSETVAPPLIISGSGLPTYPRPILQRHRPRSRATQVGLVALIACLALVVLYAARPLSAGAATGVNSFLAQGAIFAYPPTATPTATPTPKPYTAGGGHEDDPGTAAIIADIQAIFGADATGALAIAKCESGYNPNAWNSIAILGSHASGVFQILYPITWNGTSQSGQSPYNYHANILAAHEIFTRDGNSWREWACKSY